MPIDFNKPATTDNYSTAFVPNITQAFNALGQMLDPATAGTLSNTPTGAHRLNSGASGGGIFEFFNGTSWAERTMAYAKLSGAVFTGAVSGITTLSTTGNVTLGDAQADTLNVGNGDIQKDASGRTGFGVAPVSKVHIKSTSEILRLETTTVRGSGSAYVGYYDPTGVKAFVGFGSGSNDDFEVWNVLNASINFGVNNVQVAQVNTGGLSVTGTVTATAFSGSGSGLSSVPFASLTGLSSATPAFASLTVVPASGGFIGLNSGDASHTGYLSFLSSTSVRQGYIGFSTSAATTDAGTLPYVAGTHSFTGAISGSSTITAAGLLLGNGGSKGYGAITTTTTTTTPTGGASGDFVLVY